LSFAPARGMVTAKRERIMAIAAGSIEEKFLGTWRLVGVVREEAESGRKLDVDATPTGYISYTPDHRLMVIISHVSPGKAEEFTCYAAQWHLEGDTVVHQIDVTNRPRWKGTRQLRNFRFEGDNLVLTPPVSEDYTHGTVTRRSLTWQRVAS
jgi:hypothetical protein